MKKLFVLTSILCGFAPLWTQDIPAEIDRLLAEKSREEQYQILTQITRSSIKGEKELVAARKYMVLARTDSNVARLGMAYQILGGVYWLRGDFDSAFVNYDRAIKAFKASDVPLETFDNFTHLGLLFFAVKDYPKSEF